MRGELVERLTGRKAKDLRVLATFVHAFCQQRHRGEPKEPFAPEDPRVLAAAGGGRMLLCRECTRLLQHGTAKLLLCPYDPKPMCKKCPTHCYAPFYRERVRQVMKFSGMHMMKRGRLDMLFHYFF